MWFPVIAQEVADAERSLGVALPPRYKALVSDPLVREALANPLLGALVLDRSMIAHVEIVKARALALPGFPDHAVIAADNGGRYVRFWLPDPKRPGTLGEMVFSWDTIVRRGTKDAASSTIIRSMLSLLAPREPEAPPHQRPQLRHRRHDNRELPAVPTPPSRSGQYADRLHSKAPYSRRATPDCTPILPPVCP